MILGGCGGIGRVLTQSAWRSGYEPIVLDLPASIEAHPPAEAEAIPVDASNRESLEEAARHVPDDLTGYVNLCGFTPDPKPVIETDPEHWSHVIDGNLGAAYQTARLFAGKIRRGGAVVHVGSGLGHFARPGYGPYAISKAGIAALTRQLALELAPDIRVNCVAPSAVDTAFLRGGTGRSDESRETWLDIEAYAAAIPLRRIAVPEDVTEPILFLLSGGAGYITGQVLQVNGGAYMP